MNEPAQKQPADEGRLEAPVRRLVQKTDDCYESEEGFVMRREEGKTPNGNPIAGRWVLRDKAGAWVDFDQYRHDLAAQNGFDLIGRTDCLRSYRSS